MDPKVFQFQKSSTLFPISANHGHPLDAIQYAILSTVIQWSKFGGEGCSSPMMRLIGQKRGLSVRKVPAQRLFNRQTKPNNIPNNIPNNFMLFEPPNWEPSKARWPVWNPKFCMAIQITNTVTNTFRSISIFFGYDKRKFLSMSMWIHIVDAVQEQALDIESSLSFRKEKIRTNSISPQQWDALMWLTLWVR